MFRFQPQTDLNHMGSACRTTPTWHVRVEGAKQSMSDDL